MMNRLLKIIVIPLLISVCCFSVNVYAETITGYLNDHERNCRNVDKLNKEIERFENYPVSNISNKAEVEQKKKKFTDLVQCIVNACTATEKNFPNSMNILNANDDKNGGDWKHLWLNAKSEHERNEVYNKWYSAMLSNLAENANSEIGKQNAEVILNNYNKCNANIDKARDDLDKAFEKGGGKACGPNFPYGCAEGKTCVKTTLDMSGSSGTASTAAVQQINKTETYACKDAASTDKTLPMVGSLTSKEVEEGNANINTAGSYGGILKSTVNSDGSSSRESILMGFEGPGLEIDKYGKTVAYKRDNSACDIAGMQQNYQSRCYSCKVILTLITVFMNACAKVYDLTREAGSKILVIGCLFWFASFSLKKVSAFTSQEPMQVLNELFIFMFKAMAAYIVLNFGIAAIVNLFINPLLVAGADYGIGLMKAANSGIINIAETTNYPYTGTEIIPAKTINKLMALTQGIDKTVATNLVVGHALTCHAVNAGLITLVDEKILGFQITLRIPDIWIWLCGAAIWFCGFMLTLGVGYYLLDTSYRIGFCIIALPIVIGLWPFEKTKGKFSDCMSIIIRASALFAFLSLTVSYALTLISGALGDVSTLYAKVQAGDSIWISNTFAITGSKFIIIVFAYVYSIKLVGATVTSLLSKFFDDKAFGNEGKHTSMHYKATQMTDFAKKKVTQAASAATGVVAHQSTRLVGAAAGKATHAVGSLARGAINMAKKKKSSGSDE